jgi:MFS transporter, DHA1 family, inner membrane transport protein
MPRLLYLLAVCNLVIGTGAFVLNGILVPLSESLQVSVSAAGQATTVYAIATAVLAPLALVWTGGWSRRHALVLGMLLFSLGNLVCAFASSLWILLAGRVVMGLGAMFTPIAAGIAVAMVEPARRGRALSLVFLGMSLSYVIGLPLGSWLGLQYGWRWPVALIVVASLLCSVALWVQLPRDIQAPGANFRGLTQVFGNAAVRWALLLTLCYFVAIFVVFAYIGPVLQALEPMSKEGMSFTLMVFGLAGVAGTLSGGWANDRFGAPRTMMRQLALLAAMMALVPLTRGHYGWMLLVFIVWGIAGFGMMTPQQSRLASLAPAQAPILLSLNTSMLYIGTAIGAAVGGAASAYVGFDKLAWVGVPFAVAGIGALWMSTRKTALLRPA